MSEKTQQGQQESEASKKLRLDKAIQGLNLGLQDEYYTRLAQLRTDLAKKADGIPPQVSLDQKEELVNQVLRREKVSQIGLTVDPVKMETDYEKRGTMRGAVDD